MKRTIPLLIFICISLINAVAQNANAITGVWLNEEKDARIEVYKSGNQFFGKIIWAKRMYDADGKTLRKDTKNPDAKLRNNTIINLVILTGLTFDNGVWVGGEIYDPNIGKQYTCKVKLDGKKLEIRGYIGTPMFGRTAIWTRPE